ncbi:hypothetical protein DL93DRAFT_56835 [Clavulina sp. PMI_390]|nr:hypothetical protein DL93DRAFT_56835 [Clavulina sp. PMI_390]
MAFIPVILTLVLYSYCIDVIVHGLPPPPRHQHMLYKKAQILLDISSELSPDSELFPDPVLRISDENGPFINAANNLIRRFTPAASANTDSSPSSSLESPYSRHQSIEAQSFSLSSSSAESMLRQSSDLSIDTTPLDTPLPHAASSLGSSPNSINTPPFPVTAFALEMERFREVEGTDMQLSWHDTWKNIETVWPDYFDEMGGPGPRRNPLFASACSNTAPHPNKGAGPVAGSVAPAGPAVASLPPPSVPNDPWVPPPGFTVPW